MDINSHPFCALFLENCLNAPLIRRLKTDVVSDGHFVGLVQTPHRRPTFVLSTIDDARIFNLSNPYDCEELRSLVIRLEARSVTYSYRVSSHDSPWWIFATSWVHQHLFERTN